VNLTDKARKYPAQLSGGVQQRIAFARAIATSPGLLLLDAPLSALDAKARVYLRHEIKELQRKLGVTTIMVTHDQEEALSMADRIVVMNHGVIEQIGTPTEIYCEPATLFVADFIGEMNQFAALAGPGSLTIGARTLQCAPHGFSDGEAIIAAIRPEDIIPHAEGARSAGAQEATGARQNDITVTIDEMEFLGSFWRARLSSDELGEKQLIADFSINAARRLSLRQGGVVSVELPAERLLTYATGADRPPIGIEHG